MKRARIHTTKASLAIFHGRIKNGVFGVQTLKPKRAVTGAENNKTVVMQVPKKVPIQVWQFEKAYSSIEFSARHFRVVNVGGRFNDFELKVLSSSGDFSDAVIELIIRVDSLDTGNAERDELLKSEEWLNAKKYPTINFNSTSLKKLENKTYELIGNITIHGVSHTVTMEAVLNGIFTNRYPQKTIAGFTVHGMFDRSKFQIGGESGATGISYEIEIGANIEIVKG